jgi:hypothetical protein
MRSVMAYYILIAAGVLCPAHDTAMLRVDRLLDKDFTWTDFEGKTQTRPGVLRDIPSEQQAVLKYYTYGELGDVQGGSVSAQPVPIAISFTTSADVWMISTVVPF